jgi:glycosyltransferase involved in cell wall biosynthesis
MLSVLIPTYNYNAFPLVAEIHRQLIISGIGFEIICIDDASGQFLSENEKINSLSNSRFEVLQTNIGRSKMRNLLARKAQYNWMLFLDVDVMPESEMFISNYIPFMNDKAKAVNGGIRYQHEKPEQQKLFRWTYGTEREALSYNIREEKPYLRFLTLNFMIHKSIFEKVSFNESIPNLRHEDTLFSYDLMQQKISIIHIDNPIIHLGLDPFEKAIKKEDESLVALLYLLDRQLLDKNYLQISKVLFNLKKWKLAPIIAFSHKMTRTIFLKQLAGKNPSMFIFDLYRLGYLCELQRN